VQLDHESGAICRRTSDLSYSHFRQSQKTFLIGQWDQSAVRNTPCFSNPLTYLLTNTYDIVTFKLSVIFCPVLSIFCKVIAKTKRVCVFNTQRVYITRAPPGERRRQLWRCTPASDRVERHSKKNGRWRTGDRRLPLPLQMRTLIPATKPARPLPLPASSRSFPALSLRIGALWTWPGMEPSQRWKHHILTITQGVR